MKFVIFKISFITSSIVINMSSLSLTFITTPPPLIFTTFLIDKNSLSLHYLFTNKPKININNGLYFTIGLNIYFHYEIQISLCLQFCRSLKFMDHNRSLQLFPIVSNNYNKDLSYINFSYVRK